LPLSLYLGTLAGGLGCFPFEHGAYPPHSDSHSMVRQYSEFDWVQ
jgi:hypothetical protein